MEIKYFQAYSIAECGNTNVKNAAQFAACIRCCYSVLLQMKSFYNKSPFMELQLQKTFSVIKFAKKIRPSMHQPSVHCDWRSSAMTFIKNSLVGKLMKNSVVKSSVHCIIHQEKFVQQKCTTGAVPVVNSLSVHEDYIIDSLLIFQRYQLRIAVNALLHWTWFILLPQVVESLLWVDKWIYNSQT
jgi:hypothetical protein